jgi:hypothetical protein
MFWGTRGQPVYFCTLAQRKWTPARHPQNGAVDRSDFAVRFIPRSAHYSKLRCLIACIHQMRNEAPRAAPRLKPPLTMMPVMLQVEIPDSLEGNLTCLPNRIGHTSREA